MKLTEKPLSNVLMANKGELQRGGEPQDSGTLCISSPLVTGSCIFQATKAKADSSGFSQERPSWAKDSPCSPMPSPVSPGHHREHSQLQDQNDVCLVLIDLMQGDDIWVPDLLQDADLPLDVLPAHTPPAGLGPPFLDELGCILKTGTFLTTFLHDCELSTGREKWNSI